MYTVTDYFFSPVNYCFCSLTISIQDLFRWQFFIRVAGRDGIEKSSSRPPVSDLFRWENKSFVFFLEVIARYAERLWKNLFDQRINENNLFQKWIQMRYWLFIFVKECVKNKLNGWSDWVYHPLWWWPYPDP